MDLSKQDVCPLGSLVVIPGEEFQLFFQGSPGLEGQLRAGGKLRISPERSGGFPA